MSVSRRSFVRSVGLWLAGGALGLSRSGRLLGSAGVGLEADRHHVLLITLRGGFDSIQSLDPKDSRLVAETLHCGYLADERIQGTRRLFGPLIGGLERHDDDLCLVHGVRSDTTSHSDGLAMLARGATRGRSGKVAELLGETLPGDAPLRLLDMSSPDGRLQFHEADQPEWGDLRARVHQEQIRALGAGAREASVLSGTRTRVARLERFLDAAGHDASELDRRFHGDLAQHLRLAFQAIRGNWARCVNVAARANWFDSHSDNDRFQRERQPSFFADLATLIDMLRSHRVGSGTLLDRTTIAVFSEFGRFPRLNAEGGKDHFPENSWILLGRGVRGGRTIGETDDRGVGRAIDFRTGTAKDEGGRPIFLDNTFATLIAVAGGDPTGSGYRKDAVLDCVLA